MALSANTSTLLGILKFQLCPALPRPLFLASHPLSNTPAEQREHSSTVRFFNAENEVVASAKRSVFPCYLKLACAESDRQKVLFSEILNCLTTQVLDDH